MNRISSDIKAEHIATTVVIESVCYCSDVACCSNRFFCDENLILQNKSLYLNMMFLFYSRGGALGSCVGKHVRPIILVKGFFFQSGLSCSCHSIRVLNQQKM